MVVNQPLFEKLRLVLPLGSHPMVESKKLRREREMLVSMGLYPFDPQRSKPDAGIIEVVISWQSHSCNI